MPRSLSRWMLVLAGLAFLLGAAPDARAGGKVDWSQYLEKPGDRLPATRTAPVAEKAPKQKRATKAAKRPAKARAGKTKRAKRRR